MVDLILIPAQEFRSELRPAQTTPIMTIDKIMTELEVINAATSATLFVIFVPFLPYLLKCVRYPPLHATVNLLWASFRRGPLVGQRNQLK